MTMTYQLRSIDFAAAARYMMTHHQLIRRQFINTERGYIIAAALMTIALPYIIYREQYFLIVIVSAVLMTAFFFGYRYYLQQNYIKRFVQVSTNNNPRFTRNVTIQLKDDGISSSTELGSGELFWSSIQSIDEDQDYIYMLLASPGVIVIPKATFTPPEMLRGFVDGIKSHVK